MGSYNFSRLKVAIVEDDANMRTILRMTLGKCGVEAMQFAGSAAEGYALVKEFRPDLAITDWQMRGGDGIDLIHLIRGADDSPDRYLPIIMISGFAHLDHVREARDAGVTDFLAKPISAQRLVRGLASVIERPRPFVEAPDFFGPCRRGSSAADFKGPDRRSLEPQEAPTSGVALTGEAWELEFEEPPGPSLVRPPNKLRHALGPLDGPDASVLIARIEGALASLKSQYVSWAEADLTSLYGALDAARQRVVDDGGQLEDVHDIAHNMRGQAGTFDYPLITRIGSSLCTLVEGAGEFGPEELHAIELHVQAMHTVIGGRIEGEGDEQSRSMIAGLQAVTLKYAA